MPTSGKISTQMDTLPKHFKGWAIPGPIPPGGEQPEADETLDALAGRYKIFQLRDGHRYSTDDLLTAWYGTTCAGGSRRVLDLGSGIGSVGMTAAWRLQGALFVTVEAQPRSVALARKSARYNGLEDRYEIREGDFRDPAVFRDDEKFDLVLGSPPYFPQGTGVESEHPQKQACRFELRGDVGDYCAAAAPRLAPGGWFACVFPVLPETQRKRVLEGARAAGLLIVRARDICLREGEPPLLGVFAMMKAEDLPERLRGNAPGPLWQEAPLTIRCKDGSVHPEYAGIKLSIGFPP